MSLCTQGEGVRPPGDWICLLAWSGLKDRMLDCQRMRPSLSQLALAEQPFSAAHLQRLLFRPSQHNEGALTKGRAHRPPIDHGAEGMEAPGILWNATGSKLFQWPNPNRCCLTRRRVTMKAAPASAIVHAILAGHDGPPGEGPCRGGSWRAWASTSSAMPTPRCWRWGTRPRQRSCASAPRLRGRRHPRAAEPNGRQPGSSAQTTPPPA